MARSADDLAVAANRGAARDSFADPVSGRAPSPLDRPSDFVSNPARLGGQITGRRRRMVNGLLLRGRRPAAGPVAAGPVACRACQTDGSFGDDHYSRNVLLVRLDGSRPQYHPSVMARVIRRFGGALPFAICAAAWERLTDSVHRCRLPVLPERHRCAHKSGCAGLCSSTPGPPSAGATAIARPTSSRSLVCQVTHVVTLNRPRPCGTGSSVFDQAEIVRSRVVGYRSFADRKPRGMHPELLARLR